MKTLLNSAFTVSLALFLGACVLPESDRSANHVAEPGLETQDVQLEEPAAVLRSSRMKLTLFKSAQLADSLREQQIAMVVREHVTHARQAYADARLLEAEDNLLAALSLDASASEAVQAARASPNCSRPNEH